MSSVTEIQDAIACLPEDQLFALVQWLHTQHDWSAQMNREVAASVERGSRQLDAGEGVLLEDVRKLTSAWTTR